ncbi:MAG: BBP7 family outer membrane beta-barrel protein [Planctomycetia bacterium]|nr:BBP7 family outer membrane beta-barrel protein [Planctomycetia bacterium]
MKHCWLAVVGTLLVGVGTMRAQAPAAPGALDSPAWADAGLSLEPCPTPQRSWASAEYLMWWIGNHADAVPLVTTTSDNPLILGSSGTSTSPTTTVLLGGALDSPLRSGGRFTAGFWLDDTANVAVEGSYFFLAPRTLTQSVGTPGTPGSPNLFVPFFDVSGFRTLTGLPGEATGPIAGPGFPFAGPLNVQNGVFTERYQSSLQGAELNGLYRLATGGSSTLDLVAGLRWVQVHEDLNFSGNINGVPGSNRDGLIYNFQDDFNARNNFYGAQLGLRTQVRLGRGFDLSATGKVALGAMHQAAAINGFTSTNFITGLQQGGAFNGAALQALPGGVFAQPGNIGDHSQCRFAVVPEVTVNLSYQLASWVRIHAGYNFLLLTNVARPDDLIDRNINASATGMTNALRAAGFFSVAPVGPTAPTFNGRDSVYWAQGLNFGLGFSW